MRVTLAGKGGAGKSTLAGLLCWTLAGRGERVLAVDADAVPGLAQVLGIDAGDAWLLGEAVRRREDRSGWDLIMSPEEVVERFGLPGPPGIRFLQMGNALGELNETEIASFVAFSKVVPDLDDATSWVVVDLYGGTLQTSAGWSGSAGVVLVVVEPFAKSVITAGRLAEMSQPGTRLLGVASKIHSPGQRRQLEADLARIGIPLWAEMPADAAVTDAERRGVPLVELSPESPAMRAVADIADRLPEELRQVTMAAAEAKVTEEVP